MRYIQVRNVPEDVHRALARRARDNGQSLQQYLSAELAQLATRPTSREVFERIEARGNSRRFSIEQAVQSVRADRDGIS